MTHNFAATQPKNLKKMKRILLTLTKRLLPSLTLLTVSFSLMAQNEETDSIIIRQLREVMVNVEKPQVAARDGVMSVDLPAIVRDKPVSNILEALGYLPGVVSDNGMIGLAGATGVTILLDGELTGMPVENLYQLLSNIPVDRLKTVEVMYTAPARYHVSGAVINLVLKTPTPLDGLRGQVRAGYNQARRASYGGAVAATYAVNDWIFDMNYGLSRTQTLNHEETFSNHLIDGSRILIEDDMRRLSKNIANTIYAAVTFRRLRLTYNGQITCAAKWRSASTGTLGNFTNISTCNSPVNYHNLALRYTSPFGLTAGGDYTYYGETRTQTLYSGSQPLLGQLNRQHINGAHIYLDMQHPIGEWELGYGAEFRHASDRSSQAAIPADGSDGFTGRTVEDVADAYIALQRSFDFGLSFNISAKGEYYHTDSRHNVNFIPQLGATFYRTPASIFQLNLSTDRIYPAYWELRAGTSPINPYAMVVGNPSLQPYLNYAGQLSYILRQKYVATLYMLYGDKETVQLPYQAPDELSLIYQTVNMNFQKTAGLNLNIPFGVGDIWNATATLNFFHEQAKADRFHDLSFDNRKWVVYGQLSNTFKFGASSPVSLSLDFTYLSPTIQGIATLSHIRKVDAGIKWQFGKGRCCELDMHATDIFNRWSPTMTIDRAGQDFRMKARGMTRSLKLTFIWRFNGFKAASDPEIDTSRFGTGN